MTKIARGNEHSFPLMKVLHILHTSWGWSWEGVKCCDFFGWAVSNLEINLLVWLAARKNATSTTRFVILYPGLAGSSSGEMLGDDGSQISTLW